MHNLHTTIGTICTWSEIDDKIEQRNDPKQGTSKADSV
jgi:hypothetical protein